MANTNKLNHWVRFKRGALIICAFEHQHGGWAFYVQRWGPRERAAFRSLHAGRSRGPWVAARGDIGSGGPYSAGRDTPNTLADALALAEAMLRRVRGRGLV
jgi:hypothetical protein